MWKNILIIGIGYIVLTWGGGLLVSLICRKLRLPGGGESGLRGAGKYMGYFERVIVGSAAFLGQPGWSLINVAVGFVLAGKLILMCLVSQGTVDKSRVERLLAGTFASLFVALLVGYVLKILLPDLIVIHTHSGLGPGAGSMH